MSEEIILWVNKEELEWCIEMQCEARTRGIRVHSFPVMDNDIPIKVHISSRAELDDDFAKEFPNGMPEI